MRNFLFILVLAAAACGGEPTISTPEPLIVVDTFPANGSTVDAGMISLVAVAFSAEVKEDDLKQPGNVKLSETTEVFGTEGPEVALQFREFRGDIATAVFDVTGTIGPGKVFRIFVSRKIRSSATGATLTADYEAYFWAR